MKKPKRDKNINDGLRQRDNLCTFQGEDFLNDTVLEGVAIFPVRGDDANEAHVFVGKLHRTFVFGQRMHDLADRHRRFGHSRLHVLLRREDFGANYRKTHRI